MPEPLSVGAPQPRRRRNAAAYWRACWSWRFSRPHPASRNDQRWYMMASTTLKKLRETESVDDSWVRDYITWYWCWQSRQSRCDDEDLQGPTATPVILHGHVDAYRRWLVQYRYAQQHATIPVLANQQFGDLYSIFPGPWDREENE